MFLSLLESKETKNGWKLSGATATQKFSVDLIGLIEMLAFVS
jgi:hypothetical protein